MVGALDVNKEHGHDKISVRIIKLCTKSVAHQLTLIFQNSMDAIRFATKCLPALLAVCSLTYLKRLTEYDTMDYYLYLNKMVLVEIYFN